MLVHFLHSWRGRSAFLDSPVYITVERAGSIRLPFRRRVRAPDGVESPLGSRSKVYPLPERQHPLERQPKYARFSLPKHIPKREARLTQTWPSSPRPFSCPPRSSNWPPRRHHHHHP